jgi:hypothetical protein
MAGFACGTKLTAVPEVLVTLTFAIAAFLLWKNISQWWRAVRSALIFATVALLTFSPWLARNAMWAGNPVFPEATRLLGPGNFTPVQVERWQRAHSARPDQRHLGARLHAGATEILTSWQYGYVLVPLGLMAAVSARRRRLANLLAAMLLATILFWLFATHLEGRFFVLALPLCAWLIAQIDWPAMSAAALIVVLVSAGISGARLHHDIVSILRGTGDSPFPEPTIGLLGLPDISGLEAGFLDGLAPGQDVVLIGDAKAFFYTTPMSQLHYRTVFDVHAGDGDLMMAWNGGPIPFGARVIVDPPELERFHKTYWEIPEMPEWMLREAPKDEVGRAMPYVVGGGTHP